ncbi:MAG: FHA domain-containing protein [Isosphaeraceae bacterium]
MDFELHVVRGRSATQALKLADGINSVGRHDDCNVRIKSSQVSRKHCELFEKAGRLILKDLGSANGTFVNGKKVEGQLVLELGDELSLGGIKLRVAKVGAPPASASAGAPKAASDTAVSQAISPSDATDDEFEIDFEEDAVAAIDDDAIPFDLDEEPVPASPPKPAASATPAADAPDQTVEYVSKKTEPEAPADHGADEAIADFLLDIRTDDDD